jgi:hypothetical protein
MLWPEAMTRLIQRPSGTVAERFWKLPGERVMAVSWGDAV